MKIEEMVGFEEVVTNFLEKNKIDANCKDPYIKNFKQKLGRFLGQKILNEELDIKSILLEFLYHYKYYSKSYIEELLENFYIKITSDLNLDERYTIYSHIPSEKDISRGNSSSFYLQKFLDVNYLESKRVIDINALHLQFERDKFKKPEKIPGVYNKIKHIDNIIFIDDFSGSGSTIKSFLKNCADFINTKNIIIYLFHITESAENEILKAFKTYGYTKYHLFFEDKSSNIFSKSRYTSKKEILKAFEKNKINSDKPLGFEECATLVTFFRNCPNNTISSYWFSGINWTPLFPRKEDTLDLFGKEKEIEELKQNINYNLSVLIPDSFKNKYDFKDILYLMYLKESNEYPEEIELSLLLGYNNSQLLEHTQSLKSKLLISEENQLMPQAISILKELKVYKYSFSELIRKREQKISEDALEIDDIYLPLRLKN